MNVDDRMGECRDKGRMWGRVGAWCLSWWQRDPWGTSWSTQVAPQRGQAQGPLIHSTPPLVPTGPWAASTSLDRITRFGRQHSLGARVVKGGWARKIRGIFTRPLWSPTRHQPKPGREIGGRMIRRGEGG